jgi:hypothetical protein
MADMESELDIQTQHIESETSEFSPGFRCFRMPRNEAKCIVSARNTNIPEGPSPMPARVRQNPGIKLRARGRPKYRKNDEPGAAELPLDPFAIMARKMSARAIPSWYFRWECEGWFLGNAHALIPRSVMGTI